jgi:hypothetical protein
MARSVEIDGPAMSEVIDIQEALYWRAAAGSQLPKTIGAGMGAEARRVSRQLSMAKAKVRRSILLLDVAAQRAHLLVQEISDPPRRATLEAQIVSIEQLLHVARQLAANL